MERGEFGYDLLLVLHLVGVVVGFGSVVLNGLYGAESKQRKGPGGLAIGEANFRVSSVAEWFIYSVPVSGIVLVLVSDAWDFDQTWVWLSLALYVIGLGVSHGNQIPSARRMNVLAAELVAGPPPGAAPPAGPPPQVAEMEQLGKRLAAGGAFLNLLLAALLVLMVFKPGV